FAAAGVHGTAALTALTAQNTVGVDAVEAVSPAMIVAQIRAVAGDIGVDAAKLGMLGTEETIDAVVEGLGLLPGGTPVVVDPVMVAESGAPLLEPSARSALVARILPRAHVATPNLLEARELTGLSAEAPAAELARAVQNLGPEAVIVTGGHGPDGADVLAGADGGITLIPGPVHDGGAAHGSGCTHSATVAALLARGIDLADAATGARAVAAEAVGRGLRDLGAGAGPVDVIGLASRRER
ncbi:MAG TPA: bifunctional hydroxymethylpyrimidine kinase/phosphomethylpyrimidine kinase, partial [Solirubrobacterales bacterium]|nr:bifunctional hydroxymethylpyrimidine kinase/phosphomethylpyrimidine kinase [Solirubrobacterales bacterium]